MLTRLVEIGLSNAMMTALLAVLAAGLCRLYRRPAFAHGLWLVVLLKLLTPPLVPVPFPWFGAAERASVPSPAEPSTWAMVVETELPELEAVEAIEDTLPARVAMEKPGAEISAAGDGGFLPAAWVVPVFFAWLAGAVVCFVWIAGSTYRFQRLLRFAREAGPDIQDLVTGLAAKLGLTRAPRVWLIPGAVSPMLWALACRPRLLFPAPLLERLGKEQLETLFAHELAHWRRRDHWVRFLELVVQVLYWWHPAVWWARSELHEAEEQCCDAWVVASIEGADRTYALALLETVAFISHARLRLPATASGIGQVPHLRRRLTMIMGGQTSKSLTWAGCIGLAGFGLALLPLVPVRAQTLERTPIEVQVQVEQKKGSLDQQIEALKRVLQMLEEQKRSGKRPAPETVPANPEEINRARAEVKKLADMVTAKRDDLVRAEKVLHDAQARLAKLEGKTAAWRIDVVRPTAVRFAPPKQEIRAIKIDRNRQVIVLPADKAGRPNPDDLKQRLDRLLRDIEELRRDIQRPPQANPLKK